MLNETSWMAESVEDKPTSWSMEKRHPQDPKQIREMNKRYRSIYEEAGVEYGDDVGPIELAKRYKVAADLRKTHIKGVLKSIRAAKNVEVCFLVDATGSMQKNIDGVKNSITRIVDLLKQPKEAQTTLTLRQKVFQHANKLRLSMVAYRDFSDIQQFEILQFTESVEDFKKFCSSINATGGGDIPEDVFGGFQQALNLGWSDECGTKVIFHIADSPCHGDKYIDYIVEDDFPNGDPSGFTEADLFNDMLDEGIDYYFGKVNVLTDKMIQMFSKAYGKEITQFNVEEVEAITDSVFNAVSTSILSSINARGTARRALTRTLDPQLPSWPSISKSSGRLLSFKLPKSIKDVINDVPLERNQPRNAIVKVAPNPFAHGSERYAFYGKDFTAQAKPESIVLKEYISTGKGNPAARYECTNQIQTIASFFAEKYNDVFLRNVGYNYLIKFLKVQTLCLPISGTEARLLSCEKQFGKEEKFIRFTNNADFEMMVEAAEKQKIDIEFVWALTAFSHWTYQVTNGHLMVVDLQGIITKDEDDEEIAILTDPAIHCLDQTRFGRMNHGKDGMDLFFKRHRCNFYCESLKLNPVTII